MLIVNTGNGKGKTTAAVGQIVRSLGQGWRVCLIQLFKGDPFYGEQKVLVPLKNLDFFAFAPRHPFCFPDVRREDVRKDCREALTCLRNAVKSKKYQLIVLDEFNIALREGFIEPAALLAVLKRNRAKVHIVVTGRGAPERLIRMADLVTEMCEIKHPYNDGVKAREGLEF